MPFSHIGGIDSTARIRASRRRKSVRASGRCGTPRRPTPRTPRQMSLRRSFGASDVVPTQDRHDRASPQGTFPRQSHSAVIGFAPRQREARDEDHGPESNAGQHAAGRADVVDRRAVPGHLQDHRRGRDRPGHRRPRRGTVGRRPAQHRGDGRAADRPRSDGYRGLRGFVRASLADRAEHRRFLGSQGIRRDRDRALGHPRQSLE